MPGQGIDTDKVSKEDVIDIPGGGVVVFNEPPKSLGLPSLYSDFLEFCNKEFLGDDGKTYVRTCSVDTIRKIVTFNYITRETDPDLMY